MTCQPVLLFRGWPYVATVTWWAATGRGLSAGPGGHKAGTEVGTRHRNPSGLLALSRLRA